MGGLGEAMHIHMYAIPILLKYWYLMDEGATSARVVGRVSTALWKFTLLVRKYRSPSMSQSGSKVTAVESLYSTMLTYHEIMERRMGWSRSLKTCILVK